MSKTIHVSGMTCEGCVRAVTNALKRVAPSSEIRVDLAQGLIEIGDEVPEAAAKAAIEEAGFEVVEGA